MGPLSRKARFRRWVHIFSVSTKYFGSASDRPGRGGAPEGVLLIHGYILLPGGASTTSRQGARKTAHGGGRSSYLV
eukprot:5460792-Pleurochrysis_carterae.AAC.1